MKIDLQAIKEKAVATFKEIAAPAIEVEVKKQIEANSDKYVDMLLVKITALIPGNFDDALAASVAPKLKADLKAALLAEADKISDRV